MDGSNPVMRIVVKADACGAQRLGQLCGAGGADNDRCHKGPAQGPRQGQLRW